jgi:hypothetical protein
VNEFLIVTQSDQRLVKLLIDADELLFWQRRAVPVGIRPELGDGADLGVARALNGQSDPDGFQDDANLVQIADLLKVDRRAEEADQRLEGQEPLRHETVERLAKRRPAHLEVRQEKLVMPSG